jgi:D-alanyl-D-alanine carboxypeptidase
MFNHAMQNPVFREIVATKTKTVSALMNSKTQKVKHIPLRNHNRLLWNFEGALGGKTGYTRAAQKCFVGSASRDGVTVTVSILGSRNLWRDTTRLLEYGLESPQTLQAAATRPGLLSSEGIAFAQENPAPARLSAPKLAIPETEGFALQLASFQQRELAEALRERIAQRGYRTRIVTVHLQNIGTMSQVQVGPYSRIAEAQKAARAIEKIEGLEPIILQLSADAAMIEKHP